MTELKFIGRLRQTLAGGGGRQSALPIPIGDDCALVPATNAGVLFAADMLMEGVHFDLGATTPDMVGRKALAVNISDIAAMAGTPTSATVSLALPRHRGTALGENIMSGVLQLATELDIAIAGGDTNAWDGPLVISVAITGDPHPKGSVRRNGARPGDRIFVTGALGGSIHGRHLSFTPRIGLARDLHERFDLSAMIDLSDGLATDLRHILEESQVGASLSPNAIPIHPDCRLFPTSQSEERWLLLEHAISDGEDFELCFTLPGERAEDVIRYAQEWHLPIVSIGVITDRVGQMQWRDGSPVVQAGYTHTFY